MTIVGGFLSPSHDIYAVKKLLTEAIPVVHRLAMAEIAVSKSDWISISSWESLGNDRFITFYKVLEAVNNTLKEKFPDTIISIMYLCGADLIIRCNGMDTVGEFGVVAVGRPGYSDSVKKILTESASKLYFVAEDTEDISSTLIRNKIKNNEPIDDLTFPGVTQYMSTHSKEFQFTETDVERIIMGKEYNHRV